TDEAGLLFGRGFQREMEADAVCGAGGASPVETFFRFCDIDRILRYVGFKGPVIWRKDAVSDAGLAVQEKFYQGFAVGSAGEGFANFAFGEERILKIDAEVGEVGAGAL